MIPLSILDLVPVGPVDQFPILADMINREHVEASLQWTRDFLAKL